MRELARLERILALALDPRLRLEDLEICISEEPGLSDEVVRIAGSAPFGMEGRIHSLTRALLILGAREVCGIAALILIQRELGSAGDELWLHSLEIAVGCELVSRHLGLGLESEAFLAGLLHELPEAPRAASPALSALLCAAHALPSDVPANPPLALPLDPDDQIAVRAEVEARVKLLTAIL